MCVFIKIAVEEAEENSLVSILSKVFVGENALKVFDSGRDKGWRDSDCVG